MAGKYGIETVFNEHTAVTFVSIFVIKTSVDMQNMNSMHDHNTMKTNAYLTFQECSFQEKFYHILPELTQKSVFPTVKLRNVLVLLLEK